MLKLKNFFITKDNALNKSLCKGWENPHHESCWTSAPFPASPNSMPALKADENKGPGNRIIHQTDWNAKRSRKYSRIDEKISDGVLDIWDEIHEIWITFAVLEAINGHLRNDEMNVKSFQRIRDRIFMQLSEIFIASILLQFQHSILQSLKRESIKLRKYYRSSHGLCCELWSEL